MISIRVLTLMSFIFEIGIFTKVCVFSIFSVSLRTSLNYMITTSSLIFLRSGLSALIVLFASIGSPRSMFSIYY